MHYWMRHLQTAKGGTMATRLAHLNNGELQCRNVLDRNIVECWVVKVVLLVGTEREVQEPLTEGRA